MVLVFLITSRVTSDIGNYACKETVILRLEKIARIVMIISDKGQKQ